MLATDDNITNRSFRFLQMIPSGTIALKGTGVCGLASARVLWDVHEVLHVTLCLSYIFHLDLLIQLYIYSHTVASLDKVKIHDLCVVSNLLYKLSCRKTHNSML